MKQKEKDLLLRDLCPRLPYGIKCIATSDGYIGYISSIDNQYGVVTFDNGRQEELCDIRPYLFPLSSITEEQYKSLEKSGILSNCRHSYEYVNPHIHRVSFIFKEFKTYSLELIDWLNKNNLDYRGIIPMGLANDATGLNIY